MILERFGRFSLSLENEHEHGSDQDHQLGDRSRAVELCEDDQLHGTCRRPTSKMLVNFRGSTYGSRRNLLRSIL